MENIMHNPYLELANRVSNLESQNLLILEKLDLILQNMGKVKLNDEFNIKGQKKASKILELSVETLQNRIEEAKVLKNEIHYRLTVSKNDRKRYFFNESALYSVKGLI
ncbi:hypothetical protein ACN5PD_05845 [Aliarcobacter butzleri]